MGNQEKNRSTKKIQLIGKVLNTEKKSELIELNKSVDFKSNIHFHKMEDLLFHTEGKLPPFRLFHYILALFTNGKGLKSIGKFSFEIKPNQAIIIPKNIIHSTTNVTEQIKGYAISFHENLFNQINLPLSFLELNKLFHYTRKPFIDVSSSNVNELISLFEKINYYREYEGAYSEKMLGLKLVELILQYHKLFDTVKEHSIKTDNLFDRFVNLVETNFRTCRNIEWYASEVNINPNHLNKTVKNHTGNSAKHFIQNRIFYEAKYLLSSTKASVKEISFDLGFQDYNYFSRQFKNFVGLTPGQYRIIHD